MVVVFRVVGPDFFFVIIRKEIIIFLCMRLFVCAVCLDNSICGVNIYVHANVYFGVFFFYFMVFCVGDDDVCGCCSVACGGNMNV